jgi:hypothetical protein
LIFEEGDLCVQKEWGKRGQSGWTPETSVGTCVETAHENIKRRFMRIVVVPSHDLFSINNQRTDGTPFARILFRAFIGLVGVNSK